MAKIAILRAYKNTKDSSERRLQPGRDHPNSNHQARPRCPCGLHCSRPHPRWSITAARATLQAGRFHPMDPEAAWPGRTRLHQLRSRATPTHQDGRHQLRRPSTGLGRIRLPDQETGHFVLDCRVSRNHKAVRVVGELTRLPPSVILQCSLCKIMHVVC